LIRLTDVSERLRVAENVDRFLQLGEVLRADEHGSRPPVPSDHHSLVLGFDPVDNLGEVVPHCP
jgi:hypothetical protein